jgi:hypothetical protein
MKRSSTRFLLRVALVATCFFTLFAPQCFAAGRPAANFAASVDKGPRDFSEQARKAWVQSTILHGKTDEVPQLGASGNYYVHSSVSFD